MLRACLLIALKNSRVENCTTRREDREDVWWHEEHAIRGADQLSNSHQPNETEAQKGDGSRPMRKFSKY